MAVYTEGSQQESTTVSSTQSCLYFPAETGTQSRFSQDSAGFDPLEGECTEDTQRRHQAYINTWAHIKQCIDELLQEQYDTLLGQVVHFVNAAEEQWNIISGHRSAAITPPQLTFIPTATINAGVSLPDHEVLHHHLRVRLGAEVTPHIVSLRSHDCASGMSAIVKEAHLQLMDGWTPDGVTYLKHKRPILPQIAAQDSSSSQQKRLHRLTMSTLISWHLEGTMKTTTHNGGESDSTSSKRPRLDEHNHKPVVLVVEDFDAFPANVMADLIVSLRPHLPSLPLVLILGLTTSATTSLHHTLPMSTLSALNIEHFKIQSPAAMLDAVISKVLIDSPLRFRLKDKALHYLFDHFLYLNFSITEVQKGLQFAVMEHFMWQPLSFLCDVSHPLTQMASTMSHAQIEMVRSVPSFRRYIESLCDPVKQLDLLRDDVKLQSIVVNSLTDIVHYHQHLTVVLRCLHVLTHKLPSSPLGCRIYEFYYQSLLGDITESDHFVSAWNFMKVIARQQLEEDITECIKLLKQAANPQLTEIANTLEDFIQELALLSSIPSNDKQTLHKGPKKINQPTMFGDIRRRLGDYLLDVLQKYLRHIGTFPLHEVFYFNQSSWLRKHLNPVVSSVIHRALSNPSMYLPSAGSVSSEESSIDPNMPDVAIAYLLHLECTGKLISTQDWMKAFISVVSSGSGSEVDDENTLHKRFYSAVAQLQFMGFVRPAKRKKDHMQRLTWYN